MILRLLVTSFLFFLLNLSCFSQNDSIYFDYVKLFSLDTTTNQKEHLADLIFQRYNKIGNIFMISYWGDTNNPYKIKTINVIHDYNIHSWYQYTPFELEKMLETSNSNKY